MFGERLPEGGPREVGRRQADDHLLELLWPVVRGAVRELPRVVPGLRGRLDASFEGGVALFGFSAGATAVLHALAEPPVPVRAAAVVAASAGVSAPLDAFERETGLAYDWTEEARAVAGRLDAAERAPEIAAGTPPPALLLLHGEADDVTPAEESRKLHRRLSAAYRSRGHGERLGLELVPGLSHAVGTWPSAPGTPPEATEAVERAVTRWLGRHLAGEPGG